MVELRDIVGVLREGEHEETRPQPQLDDIEHLVEESRGAGQQVLFDNQIPDPATVSDITGRTAYRVVQEGLTNARKHAPGQPVHVLIGGPDARLLTVELRNSVGRQGLSDLPPSGVGLAGLTERVRLAGGSLVHTVDNDEFTLSVRLPA